jgi:PAS domain S-box-containing protein
MMIEKKKLSRKTASAALQRSEERYHKMVEEVEDYAILMLDSDGFILNWNKGAERIKGYTEQEIVGKHFRIFYTPEDQAAGLPYKLVNEAREKGKAIHEGWRMRKDGTTFWGSIVITALHDDDNEVIGFSKVTRDLTARKIAEDKLLLYARQLEAQNKELQRFAYAAAHDMKEPLRKIQFYYSAILDGGEDISPDQQKIYLMRSADAARRMQGLIEDLLAFTRISEQADPFEQVDLNDLAEEVLVFYQETIDELKPRISSGHLPTIKGIPFQIRQLLLNLVGNSFKYRDPGRLLHIDITAAKVKDVENNDTYLPRQFHKISIKDNGIGFDPEHNERIFEMFERLHGREKYPGTGLGLAICRKIMDSHRGYIRAKGVQGKGSTFELFFPI